MSPDIVPLLLVSPLLVLMAVGDLKNLVIPNMLVAAMVLVFAVAAPVLLTPADIGLRLLAAGLGFAITFTCFAAGLMAGGDVKGLTAIMLFVPTPALSMFALTFAGTMVLGIVVVVTLRGLQVGAASSWSGLAARQGYPMGLSIGLAGVVLLVMLGATAPV